MTTDDGGMIIGEYSDAISEQDAARVPVRYSATITKRTKVVSIGGEVEDETYYLEELVQLYADGGTP